MILGQWEYFKMIYKMIKIFKTNKQQIKIYLKINKQQMATQRILNKII